MLNRCESWSLQVRPKVQLQTLLQQAGADKEIFTMKEVRRSWNTDKYCCHYTLKNGVMYKQAWHLQLKVVSVILAFRNNPGHLSLVICW